MNLSQFLIFIFMVLSYGEAFNVQKASFCEMRAGIKLQSTCDGCKSFYSRPVKERILLNSKTRRSLKKNCKIISRCCNDLMLRNMLSWLIFCDQHILTVKLLYFHKIWLIESKIRNLRSSIWTSKIRLIISQQPSLQLSL